MNMRYKSKWLYMLLMAAGISLVGCKQEELNTNGTEQRDPNLISVSFDMSAGVQDSIAEGQRGRALSYTLSDEEKDGKTSYSVLKFDVNTAPETLDAYGIFYCPSAPEGKKVYVSNGPIKWIKKQVIDANHIRYEIHKAAIVDVDRDLMDGTHQWYFASVLGAEYDPQTKTFSFDPYKDTNASGLKYQANGQPVNLNLPMTTNWSKLKVYAPEPANDDPWFYPEGYEVTKGQPEGVTPKVIFRPRGTVFRMRFKNDAISDMAVMSYSMESNVMAFKTTISPADVVAQDQAAKDGGKLKMKLVMGHPAEVFVNGTEGRVVKSGYESKNGATLAWGYLDEEKQKLLEPNIGHPGDELHPSPEVPYLSVRATAKPSDADRWNSMEKAADYYPITQRVSYISEAPIYYAYVRDLGNHFKDGGSEWFLLRVTSALTNLERTSFEVLNQGFEPGKPGAFKRGHPWMNRHSGSSFYWLDAVAYPNLAQLKTWMADSRGFVGEVDRDPDLVDHQGNALTNLRSTATYYLPHAEEIQSYLPIKVGAGPMDSVYLTAGEKTAPFDVNVIEQDLNIKHKKGRGEVATARFVLQGGDSEKVNALNYGKDLKTGAPIPMGNNEWSSVTQMEPYNYFNYFWCSHIVYGLAYLRKGDPESLVAYRYFWGISPEDAGVPLANNYPHEDQWKWDDGKKMNAVYGPEAAAILKEGTANPKLGETLRRLSAFSAGRRQPGGAGRSMVSFFSVAMRHIGRQDPRVRSLGDIGVVSDEKWWTANPKNVLFRIFSAVGFARPGEDADNRNRGVYILTQTNDDGAGNHDYFYIGPRSWGRFSTKNEAELSTMWLEMHKNGGINYKEGGRTPEYGQYPYWVAPNKYQISRAFMTPRSGAPTHFMVGKDPKKQ